MLVYAYGTTLQFDSVSFYNLSKPLGKRPDCIKLALLQLGQMLEFVWLTIHTSKK